MNVYYVCKRFQQAAGIWPNRPDIQDSVIGYKELKDFCGVGTLYKSPNLSAKLGRTVYHGYGITETGRKFEYYAEHVGRSDRVWPV